MKNLNKKCFCAALIMLALFVLWTVLICFVDVQAIGPQGSSVGFASLNKYVHELTGVHMSLYNLTDLLSIIPAVFIAGFALLGVVQLIKRKNPMKVDRDILALGGFYVAVGVAFVLFEIIEINYRPILIEGVLEASYPSSTTMLVMCVLPTAIMMLRSRIKNVILKESATWIIAAFTAFMVIARLVSGVHWFTDIVGGAILSAALVMMYSCVCNKNAKEQ